MHGFDQAEGSQTDAQLLRALQNRRKSYHVVIYMEPDGAAGDIAGVLVALVRDVVALHVVEYRFAGPSDTEAVPKAATRRAQCPEMRYSRTCQFPARISTMSAFAVQNTLNQAHARTRHARTFRWLMHDVRN